MDNVKKLLLGPRSAHSVNMIFYQTLTTFKAIRNRIEMFGDHADVDVLIYMKRMNSDA